MAQDVGKLSAAEAAAPPRWFAALAAVALAAGVAGSVLFARGYFGPGASLLLLGMGLLRWPVSVWHPCSAAALQARRQRLGLLLVCAVGTFFRFYRLEPPGLWGDDAINGLLALDVLEGKIGSPFALIGHAFSSFHALTNFVIAASFWLFEPSLYSLRLPGVIANLACVPLLYGIVAPLFGPRVALLAALFFASSPFQLGHAKGLLQNPLGQVFAMAGLCLLIQGGVRGRRWCLAAAGAPIALSLYTYHSAKLVPVIAGVALWQMGRIARARGRRFDPAVLGGLAVFLVCALPAVVGYARQSAALTGRVSATALWGTIEAQGSLWPLWESLWRTLAVFHYQQGPIYHWFGIGTDPGFTALAGALVLHGLIHSLGHWREPRHLLLLGWLLIGLVPGVLSSEPPRGYRVLLATPPLYVWAALPLARLIGLAERHRAKALRALAMAAVVALPLVDFNYYFYRVYSHGLFRWFQADHMVGMASALRERGPGWVGYILADTFNADYESLRFLRRIWRLDLQSAASLAEVVPARDDGRAGTLYLLSRGTLEAAALVGATYPRATLELRHDPPPRTWWLDRWWPLAEFPPAPPVTFGAFAVSRDLAASTPAPRARGLSVEVTGSSISLRRVDPFPYYFFFPPTFPGVYSARWRGNLHVTEPGGVFLRPESDRPLAVRIDGREWNTEQLLAHGDHDVDIAITNTSGALRLRLYWQPPGGERQLIPPEAFSP
jgi:4-amino-4-deoxy-L-arabinose transferase-like glycosyltransferase